MGVLYLRPDADDTDGNWTNASGNATDLYASLDESSPSDSDYIQSSENPANEVVKIRLSDPSASVDRNLPFKVRYRFFKDAASGTIDLTVRLLEGSTQRASWTESDISTTPTTTARTLTSGEVNAITDFTNLFIELTANLRTDLPPGIGAAAIGARAVGR